MSIFNRNTLLTFLSLLITAAILYTVVQRNPNTFNPLRPNARPAAETTDDPDLEATGLPGDLDTPAALATLPPETPKNQPVATATITATVTVRPATAVPSSQQQRVSRSIDSLRLRSGPGGGVIGSLPGGSVVTLTGKNQGNWVEVIDSKGRTGWVDKTYLEPISQ